MDNLKTDEDAAVLIGNKLVGDGHPCYIIAEIGINHNGDIDLARRLISVAVAAGCDAVKFQKRTVEVVYSPEELAKPRESPFGTTNGDLKRGLEFGHDEYRLIDRYCREVKMPWFASCWDEESVDFIDQFDPPCYKIASASLTDDSLLRHTRSQGQADHSFHRHEHGRGNRSRGRGARDERPDLAARVQRVPGPLPGVEPEGHRDA